ncbi:hypothetical protein BBJ28_00014901 [Nothophytophthora sp. Chile5]|nr:hypothetical protein BBJ28_00014901 [Nothophytophthora sp. Chile5]
MSTDTKQLAGKVAVITGASGGIGAAIALQLAGAGASVALGARRLDALEAVQASIAASVGSSDGVLIVKTDVTKRDDNLVKKAEDAFGPVDILVNNGGGARDLPTPAFLANFYDLSLPVLHGLALVAVRVIASRTLTHWLLLSLLQTIDINCKGTLNGVAAVLPKMLARKSGHIVNISSDAGRKVFAGLGVYSASKMFIEGISQALRLEHVGTGLRVTSIQVSSPNLEGQRPPFRSTHCLYCSVLLYTLQPGNVATDLVKHANAASGVDEEAMKLYGGDSGRLSLSLSLVDSTMLLGAERSLSLSC